MSIEAQKIKYNTRNSNNALPSSALVTSVDIPRWYALYTRSKFEKKVEKELILKGFEAYVPEHTVIRQWSDRKKKLIIPLFSCYVFVRMYLKQRIKSVETNGVISLVRFNGVPAPISDEDISSIKKVLELNEQVQQEKYMSVGELVEVVRGPLAGVRGQIVEYHGSNRLILSIEQIRHSISVEIRLSDVKCINDKHNLHFQGL